MKKWLYLLLFIFVCVFGTLTCYQPVKSKEDFVFEDEYSTYAYTDVYFCVDAKNKSGDIERYFVLFKGDGQKYVSTLYLPGYVDLDSTCLSWASEQKAKAKVGFASYKSGELELPKNGDSKTFVFTVGEKTYDFMLTVYQGSSEIKALFINIDETLGTIEDMNSDPKHDTSCFGNINVDGTNYYMSIKGRGNATWMENKKPYNITVLDENYDKKVNANIIGDIETKKWSFLANYADPSLLRNRIGQMIANDLGIGLQTEYFDVWMNGTYIGNYLATPKNDYEAPKNGYLLELDNYIDDEDPQFYLHNLNGEQNNVLFTIKDNGAKLKTEEIQDYVQCAFEALLNYESEEYQNYFDIESWSKEYLLQELYKNFDIVSGSIYMHRDGLSEDDKLIAGPIWDLDNSFGTKSTNPKSYIPYNNAISADYWYIDSIDLPEGEYSILQELGRHQSFREQVKMTYNIYKESFDSLLERMHEECELYYDSFIMNYDRWNNLAEYFAHFYIDDVLSLDDGGYLLEYKQTYDYDSYYKNLQSFLELRLKFLSDNLSD